MFLKKILPDTAVAQLSFLKGIASDPSDYKRALNRYRYRKGLKNTHVKNFTPVVFGITIVDVCNLRCPNCYYLLKDEDKFNVSEDVVMKLNDFRGVMEKFNKDKLADVVFLTGGEPLIHKEFSQFIDVVREYNASPKSSTNGIMITENIDVLKKLDYLNISIDAHDHETFNTFRGGSEKEFDKLKRGLEAMAETSIYHSFSFVISEGNVSKISKMINFASQYKPNFIYFHNINPHGSDDFKPVSRTSDLSDINNVIKRTDYPFDIHISHVFDDGKENFREHSCVQPWYYLAFNPAGDIAYCCHLEHDRKIGNIFDGYDYNSETMVKFRENMLNYRFPDKDCLYCHRRFMDEPPYALFDVKSRTWNVN